jgi:oligoendopeptidase F
MSLQQSLPIKWNLNLLKSNDDNAVFLQERDIINKKYSTFIKNWEQNTEYLTNPIEFKKALDEYEELQKNYGSYGNESFYYSLRSSLNENDSLTRAKYNEIISLAKKLENSIHFFTHRIAKVDKETQKLFLNAKELKKHKHFLELLFADSQFLLSEEVEKVLNLKSKPAYSNWVTMTSTFLSKESVPLNDESGKRKSYSLEGILSLLNSKKKEVRDQAAASFNTILTKYIDVGEAELNSVLENKEIDDNLRRLKRPDELRHISDDIESSVVDTLVETVTEHNDIAHRYYKLKAQLLGQKKLEYHERNIEYGSINRTYSYEDSVHLVEKVFKKLDPEFAEIFLGFVNNAQIDVYPQNGKRSGAFCAHNLITQPTFILLNHTNQLNDVLTLAHESGHGINNELMKKKLHALDFGSPTSTAEVASTFMEDFVLQELLEQASPEERLSLLMTKLNSDISTIFRQIAAYKFEYALHEEFRKKSFLSKADIGSLFQKYMKLYMGDAVEQSAGSENWWLYWIHIRYMFYNYSYSSGLLISKSMQSSVKNDKTFIKNVKEFLSAGRSKSPKEIFMGLHIDISKKQFWIQGIKEVEKLLEETTTLAKQLHKI